MIKLFRDTDIGGSLSGGPDPIPEDVRKKIEEEAKLGRNSRTFHTHAGDIHYSSFISGASFGFKQALPTIQAQEERIRVLEEALNGLKTFCQSEKEACVANYETDGAEDSCLAGAIAAENMVYSILIDKINKLLLVENNLHYSSSTEKP